MSGYPAKDAQRPGLNPSGTLEWARTDLRSAKAGASGQQATGEFQTAMAPPAALAAEGADIHSDLVTQLRQELAKAQAQAAAAEKSEAQVRQELQELRKELATAKELESHKDQETSDLRKELETLQRTHAGQLTSEVTEAKAKARRAAEEEIEALHRAHVTEMDQLTSALAEAKAAAPQVSQDVQLHEDEEEAMPIGASASEEAKKNKDGAIKKKTTFVTEENLQRDPAQESKATDESNFSVDTSKLPVLKGCLYKKSPSAFKLKSWDWRFFCVRDMHLLWWKTQEHADAPEAMEADGGPLCKGAINFLISRAEIEEDKAGSTIFHLWPKDGIWETGATTDKKDATRAYVFDAKGSNHSREVWIDTIRVHIEQAGLIRRHASKSVLSGVSRPSGAATWCSTVTEYWEDDTIDEEQKQAAAKLAAKLAMKRGGKY